MSEKSFEEQILDELRKTENLLYYLAGRTEIEKPNAGLEHLQERLSSNLDTVNKLYKKLSDRDSDS